MKAFTGKTAVITGAATGIGREFARQLAAQGCHLALCDINATQLSQTVAELQGEFEVHISSHIADVSDPDAVATLVDAVGREHGSIQLLINNAGMAAGGEFVDTRIDAITKLAGVNIMGPLYGTRLFLPLLAEQNETHIVFISSMVGYFGLPGNALYAASKFAVRGLAESLAPELAPHNIGVTVAHPGAIRTGIIKSGAFTNAQDHEKLSALMDKFAMPPEKAVRKILRAVRKGKLRQTIGVEAYALRGAERFAPNVTFRLLKFLFGRMRAAKAPPS